MKDIWKIAAGLMLVFSAAAAVFCLFFGECGGFLTCGTSQVPMKCHWAYLAAGCVSALGACVSLGGLLASEAQARRIVALTAILCAVLAALFILVIIGVCGNDAMSCVTNRVPALVLLALAALSALLGFAKADSAKASLPKAQL